MRTSIRVATTTVIPKITAIEVSVMLGLWDMMNYNMFGESASNSMSFLQNFVGLSALLYFSTHALMIELVRMVYPTAMRMQGSMKHNTKIMTTNSAPSMKALSVLFTIESVSYCWGGFRCRFIDVFFLQLLELCRSFICRDALDRFDLLTWRFHNRHVPTLERFRHEDSYCGDGVVELYHMNCDRSVDSSSFLIFFAFGTSIGANELGASCIRSHL